MMKKLAAALLALFMIFCMQACSGAEGNEASISVPAVGLRAPQKKAGNIADLDAGSDRIAVLLTDGTVLCVEDYYSEPVYVDLGWTNIVRIDSSGSAMVGLTEDGRVFAAGKDAKDDLGWQGRISNRYDYNWELFDGAGEIVDVASCAGRVVALKADGTVLSTNPDDELGTWTDIVAIDTMYSSFCNKIFGVRADGTVMETGSGDDCYTTSGWTDIVDICAGWSCVAGLKSDGTVVISGTPETEAGMGAAYDTSTWTDIQELSGYSEIVGLKADGTVVSTGLNETGAGHVSTWYQVVDAAAGEYFTVALKKDGTIIGTSETGNWNLSMLYG